MTVVADVSVPVNAVELGRLFDAGADASLVLERVVPMAETSVPFVWLEHTRRSDALETLERHPTVEEATVVCDRPERSLYAIDWDVTGEPLFAAIQAADCQFLGGWISNGDWQFDLRFPGQQQLSAFREYCEEESLPVEFRRVYNPTKPGTGAHYGLTPRQRETLIEAVTEGYYSIPREYSTKELGDSLGISDQAVTERLRRAIITLVENTLIASRSDGERGQQPVD
jgi:hypothetical protein